MTHDDAEFSELVLIPQPRTVRTVGRKVALGWLAVVDLPAVLRPYEPYIIELAGHVAGEPWVRPLIVKFNMCAGDSEEYMLMIGPGQVRIRASDARGALHGMRTLVGLWESTGRTGVPAGTITDGPDLAVRGLFVDPSAGTEHMGLADWHQLIDRVAQLKFTTLGVPLAGCDEDVLSGVACYAAERAIDVLPHLRGPKHWTSMPRSSVTRYVREVSRRYLLSNGIHRLHVATNGPHLDIVPGGVERDNGSRRPCASCSERLQGDKVLDYLTLVGRVLAADGISMVHWHDSLGHVSILDEYLQRCADLGIPEPTIVWRQHNDPVSCPEVRQAESWSSPTVGSEFGFAQDHLPTIETVLRTGRESGTTGVLARGRCDLTDYMNHAFLADIAWRWDGAGGTESFRRRWARYICPDNVEMARHALMKAATITASPPLMTYVINQLLSLLPAGAFQPSGATGEIRYPEDGLPHVALADEAGAQLLRQVADTLREAEAVMPEGRSVPHWGNPSAAWRDEISRMVKSVDSFLAVLVTARRSAGGIDRGCGSGAS